MPKTSPYMSVSVWNGPTIWGAASSATPSGTAHARILSSGRCMGAAMSALTATEEPGGPHEQHDRGNEIEHRQLDLRIQRDARLPEEAHDEGPGERALQAAEAADDDDDKGKDQRLHAHAEHGGLAGHHDSAAQPGHEAADGERLDVNPVHVDPERGGHAHVLGSRAQDDPEPGAVNERPQQQRRSNPDRNDRQVVRRV